MAAASMLLLVLFGVGHATAGCLSWCSEWTCNQLEECGTCQPCMPRPPPPPLLPNANVINPFASTGGWYVNPTLSANLESTIASGEASAATVDVLKRMKEIPSAYWIDHYSKIRGAFRLDTLEGILQDADSKPDPPLCVFIFYDLPNRDCNAKASNGEISFSEAEAEEALATYKTRYVDPFAEMIETYARVPVVIVIEPDSLGNAISNAGQNGCSRATVLNYKLGVRYAVNRLSESRAREVQHGRISLEDEEGPVYI